MNIKIGNQQLDKLTSIIQKLLDSQLDRIRDESDEWGLGEMDEFDEVSSIDKIVINRITIIDKIKVYIDIYKNSNRLDFNNTRSSLQYTIGEWIPRIELYVNELIDTREFGPGIDW